jgi:hypothetical protein
MVARTDIPFMMHTIPHLVRSCNFPFHKRVLFVDTAPLTGDKVNRPGVGTMVQLRENCAELIRQDVIDEAIDMDYSSDCQRQLYRKHFGTERVKPSHNFKGYPIFGSIYSIEKIPGDFVLHFDSDMLLHQQPDYNWIQAGIELLKHREDVMFVRPLSGPPTEDNGFFQEKEFSLDAEGFYRFKFFGSRVFLLHRKKFEQFLPVPVLWTKYKNQWISRLPTQLLTEINNILDRGKLDSWEVMVSRKLEETPYVRATMTDPRAWTVHPISRGPQFIENLPALIQRIEAGEFPQQQGGYYDLQLDAWLAEASP